MSELSTIPGYTYGSGEVPRSPVSLDDLDLIKRTLLFTEDDERYLRMSRDVLRDHIGEIVETWYGFVASQPHLVHYFSHGKSREPNAEYLEAVRQRFEQWILDTAEANYDQEWLDYQHEIGLRHHKTKKNRTDEVDSVPIIHWRYLPALAIPVTATLRPFLARNGHGEEEVEHMHRAWQKAVMLSVILWSHPYVRKDEF